MATALLVTTSAHAEPSAADRESARSLMVDGDRKMEARDAAGAMTAYRAAHEIMKVPSTGASYADAALAAGFFVEARDACLQVARIPAAANENAAFQKARAQCAEIVPKADAKIATITIKLTPVPGAGEPTVAFDGVNVPVGALLVPRKINPGKHVLSATLAGHADYRRETVIKEGENYELALTFAKEDGTPVAAPPSAATTPTEAPPRPLPAAGRSPLVYVGFGVAAVGFVAGGVTGGLALSKASDAKVGCVDQRCPRENQDTADGSRTLGTVSTIGFGVGLVGVGVGIYGLLSSPTPSSRPAATIWRAGSVSASPAIGPSSFGVRGSF